MTRRLATAYQDSAGSPGLALWRVTHAWQAAMRAALKPHGLTHVQFVLLASLAWLERTPLDGEAAGRPASEPASEPVSQRDLAEHADTDAMMTSQVLRTLEALGLVERRPHPTDARARALVITDAGLALANEAVVAVEAADRLFFAPLGEPGGERQRALAGMLGELRR